VNFGTPISMRGYDVDFQRLSGEERRLAVTRLGRTLMDAVGRVVPVVPVALIAHVFLARRSLTALDLKAETGQLLQRLEGAHVYVPRRDLDYALTVGLRMLTLRRLVEEREGLFSAREEELPLLRYYANSIAHLLQASDSEIR
jgi:glycerol-3-phosphate O-acyltransferase